MVTDAMIEAMREAGPPCVRGIADCALAEMIDAAMHSARPTADLGEDGELVAYLNSLADHEGGPIADKLGEAADRLILYREALEVLLLVKDAVDYRGDACHPAEMVGAVLDKCILERIDAVLSRSGG